MREAKLANEVNKKVVFVVYTHCQVATGRQLLHLLGLCITPFTPLLIVEAGWLSRCTVQDLSSFAPGSNPTVWGPQYKPLSHQYFCHKVFEKENKHISVTETSLNQCLYILFGYRVKS